MSVITFITPPSPFLLDERVFPSLGILKVAAVAEQCGYKVEHLDLNGVSNYEEAALSLCSKSQSSIFAITATTPQMVAVTQIRNAVRSVKHDARLIIGGPHPTLVHSAMKHSVRAKASMANLLNNYDTVVAGDGELAISKALTDDGLIDANDPKSDLFLDAQQLNILPFPARHLIDVDSYHYDFNGQRMTPLIAQLGCPFGCNFCAGRDSAMLRRVRLRSTENVIAEMRHIYETYGIHGFMFFDDELNVNPQMVELMKALCELQNRLRVWFTCRGFIKAELFTDEQAKWMHRAGFRRILCGFESGNERILKNINKHATRDDNTHVMELSEKYGLDVKALMSVGHPGETESTIRDSVDWLLQVKPSEFDITIITAYPGSPYYDKAAYVDSNVWRFDVNGDRLFMYDVDYEKVSDYYKGDPHGGYRSYVFTDELSAHDLVRLRNEAEAEVRSQLGIPYPSATAAVSFEASMGQLPGHILRKVSHG